MNKFRRFLGIFIFVLMTVGLVGWVYADQKKETLHTENIKAENKEVVILSTTPIVYSWLNESLNDRLEKSKIAKESGAKSLGIVEDKKLLAYVMEVSRLNEEDASYLILRAQEVDMDLFLMLGLYKAESDFDVKHVGTSGERGLGQIMNGTGRFLCKEIGIDYDRGRLFEPQYNMMLSSYYVSKLYHTYQDIHKALTAYNRGEGGLKRYIASRSGQKNPQQSGYSKNVLKYAKQFREKYEELN